jgi:acyl-coenzyme A synthetase/AMP-(fatty) acid ligase
VLVENALSEFEGIAEAVAIGVPDLVDSIAMKAFVVLRGNCRDDRTISEQTPHGAVGNLARAEICAILQRTTKTECSEITRSSLRPLIKKQPLGTTALP